MAKKKISLKGSQTKAQARQNEPANRNTSPYKAPRAFTDVTTGYGRDASGKYSDNARQSAKLGRSGQFIYHRRRLPAHRHHPHLPRHEKS